jgi:4-amino-4-deoxy-L-arabinose transferase-like glycosyltransferase
MQQQLSIKERLIRHSTVIGLIAIVLLAAFMRFWKINLLPPGMTATEARLGESVMGFISFGHLPAFTSANGYSPLMVVLEALPVKLMGATTWSLRLVPALLGTLSVLALWLWTRSWFGSRIAWIAAFLLAVSPWAITISRNGSSSSLIPLLVALTLWLVTLSYRTNSMISWILVGGVIGLDLLAGPLGWIAAGLTVLAGIFWLVTRRRLPRWSYGRIGAFGVLLVLAAVAGYLAGRVPSGITSLPATLGLPAGAQAIGASIVSSLLMFNVRGDANFQHNLGGEPLLNIFVGLMFVAGILVAATRIGSNRYRRLLLVFIAFLVPVALSVSGSPDAARAAGVLPVTMIIAALGISYLLRLWYSTFPINSAARVSGQAAVSVLLLLTAFQGYTQYFHAWAGSAETYAAYHEEAVGASRFTGKAATGHADVKRYLIVSGDELPVATYLTLASSAKVITTAELTVLPITAGSYQFILTSAVREPVTKVLADKFPGGKLKPYYSDFNDSDIYYDYQVTK